MELKAGDKVTIAQDEEDPDNFYFFKDPQHGFALRIDKKKALLFSHTAMVRMIQQAKELSEAKPVKSLIAGQPTTLKNDKSGTKYWGILILPVV